MPHVVREYAAVDAALAKVLAGIKLRRSPESVPSSVAYGRVPAADVRAPRDVPQFPTSHWDGYAVASTDVAGASTSSPVWLKVTGSAGPGSHRRRALLRGTAFQVATGAPLPRGADTVVPLESVSAGGGRVKVTSPSPPGSHVYPAGGEVKKGEVVIHRGQAIRAQDLGQLLALGIPEVKVWKRPRVSVLATGSELAAGAHPKAGRVANSHSPVFLRICQSLGCVPVDLGVVEDDRQAITRKLRSAVSRSDLILTLGGTSIGKRDHAVSGVEALNPDVLIHGLKMDRGRVAGVGVAHGRPFIMMPGPIQGAMNTFVLLGVPIIEVVAGTGRKETEVPCTFAATWTARSNYADFRKVIYVRLEGGREPKAVPLSAETESMKILTEADGYVVVPENVTRIEAGETATVRLLPAFSFA